MATVLNAKGVPLPYSGSSVRWYSATNSGPTLYGSTYNDSMYGDAAVTVTMRGGKGDDIYYLYAAKNKAVELSGEGVDTISTWMSYKLPANFENLTVTGDKRYAFGNELNNIVTGGSGQQTLDGLQGDDVLKGGSGADIFVVNPGNGSDLILDLGATDTVRVGSYGFTSFEEVRANMVQSGANVRLNLSDGEFLVFANKTIGDFTASQFKLAVDRSALELTFSDEFDTLDLWNGSSGTWDSNYWWGAENGSTLTSNNDLQWYIDTDYAPTRSVNPFSIEDGVLTITAARAPEAIRPYINNYEYTSGLLTTYESFAQTYGYFEIRADMPETQGAWPAFWLLPADGSWPPELDVIEMFGKDPNKLILTGHSNATGTHTTVGTTAYAADTEGFHTYGVLWTEDELVWYFDDVEVARAATPADMHDPMYMLVNMGIGGQAGEPADELATPAEMQIDYIHAYALQDWVI
ncbi:MULTISPECIES: family 16 glycosylhydrolase [unclassified Mesorhizobium]|uniref:glycoside hydrolase family 16 protein n=1 Tax=unclassified Mesorhizobium TaxID=325217 RepID=UPI0003D022D2|nr:MULTISPECIES: family 16 glycosylhydrolase [unclassified Mesorhizobium]ESZ19073.1 endo-1,3-1,4-beta-glycanase [Mesorhizobium sp. L48C026A00]RWN61418.1 MAG: glycosyl hydrolase family protein [Mesorhizobium sp.]RWO01917.1 MAG: glycosyl hydrolase family protein [Mesorhizobium sp.]RWO33723.1 MAG: glycosyl hydrolase family protein [Mesorhizobium sp.]RWO46292.1 MAG: glycosyl hydrolase family protein [Mesorhizobium sp.]